MVDAKGEMLPGRTVADREEPMGKQVEEEGCLWICTHAEDDGCFLATYTVNNLYSLACVYTATSRKRRE